MGEMALVVLGLFVLVWIISAVVKASQDTGPKGRPAGANRPRPDPDAPRVERTSNTDIDRFMAEIDRLRQRGQGAPGGRPSEPPRAAPRPVGESRPSQRAEPRPRPSERRDRERERERERERDRRTRQAARPPLAPPPLPSEPVPVLRPVAPEAPAAPPPPPPPPPKPVKPAKPAAAAQPKAALPSPILQTLQGVLKSKQGPAAALILAEIFGEPPGRTGAVRGPHRPKFG
jgi:hypothetical protein